ncbi:MAG: OmpA family protein [Spirochaetia bacterium]
MFKVNNGGLFRRPFSYSGQAPLFLFIFIRLLLPTVTQFEAEELRLEVFSPAAHYAHTERENVRVYHGRRYQGLQYRGRRVYLQQAGSSDSSGQLYRGSVYLIKTLTRDAVRMLQPVDKEISVECRVSHRGFTPVNGSDLPIRTGFPVLAKGDVSAGDTWKAEGSDSVYLEDGTLVTQPFQCTYTYRESGIYMQRTAQIIDFTYTFAKADPYGLRPRALRGTSTGEIALFTDENGGYFIKERLTRHYLENGTPASREEGFRLTWGRGITIGEIESLQRTMIASLQDEENGQPPGGQPDRPDQPGRPEGAPGAAGEPGSGRTTGPAESEAPEDEPIEVERTTEGIKLNLPRIHFVPDQAKILPREKDRLDKLATMLKKVPDASFMVKGHTADIGTEESQYDLSVERARTIIEEMLARGLEASRFVYQGLGGEQPVAPNDTEEGRARNRRVEVIILNQ